MIVNGWTLFAHPLLLDQLERATAAVEEAKAAAPAGYRGTAQSKLLAMLATLLVETIPSDPARPDYRQGNTSASARKHWFRAKFGNGRFRLFFRYDSRSKIIIVAWVSDQTTWRTYGSKTEAYRVFQGMLDGGSPPDDWLALKRAVLDRWHTAKPGAQEEAN